MPWVSRELYERAVREAETWRTLYDRTAVALQDVLTPKPATIVTQNGTTDLTPRPESVVAKAIRDEAGGDSRLAAWLRKRASQLRADGKQPEEIAEQLRSWQTTETEGV